MVYLFLRGLDEDEQGVFGGRTNGCLEANPAQGVNEVLELFCSFIWIYKYSQLALNPKSSNLVQDLKLLLTSILVLEQDYILDVEIVIKHVLLSGFLLHGHGLSQTAL